jgi:hypothetical protein
MPMILRITLTYFIYKIHREGIKLGAGIKIYIP